MDLPPKMPSQNPFLFRLKSKTATILFLKSLMTQGSLGSQKRLKCLVLDYALSIERFGYVKVYSEPSLNESLHGPVLVPSTRLPTPLGNPWVIISQSIVHLASGPVNVIFTVGGLRETWLPWNLVPFSSSPSKTSPSKVGIVLLPLDSQVEK